LKIILKYSFYIVFISGLLIFNRGFSQNTQKINPILTKQQTNQPDPKEKLAISFYRNRDYKKAAELFQQLYSEKPINYYYNFYFNSLIALQDYKKAERLIKQHRKLNPDNYRYMVDEAYVLGLTGNKKKSDKLLNKLLNNLPNQRNKILQITNSLQAKGYPEVAIEVFKKANLKSDKITSYSLEIANAYMYSGDYNSMFDSYIHHVEITPGDLQRVKSKLQYIMRMDVNSNLSDMLKTKLLESSQKNPENIQLAEMLMWYSLQTKDFEMAYRQARANDLRFHNGDEDMLELADISFSNFDYNISSKAFKYIVNKENNTPYYVESYVGYFHSTVKQYEDDPATQYEDYVALEKMGIEAINLLGINNTTSDIILHLAGISAFKLTKYDEAIEMIEKALSNPLIDKKKEAELKLKLADILLAYNRIWDATLLYSQVESDMKNEPVGHEAKLKNAKVFYYVGEFDWAATKLDILKSATSKLISNDAIELSLFISNMREEDTIGFILRKFAGADMYTYQGKYDSAMRLLNKIEVDPTGIYSVEYALFNKAGIYQKLNEFNKADSVYNKLIKNYPSSIKVDNALYQRAELQRLHFNDIDEAKELYMILMTDYPESIYSGKARKRYRLLDKSDNEQIEE
jgi:tetratricopeptide (TPR) repeat protein